LRSADKVCREQGYTVAEARDTRELLGHEQGQSQVEVRKSEATIYCGKAPRSANPPSSELAPPSPVSLATQPAPAPAPASVCVPGATHACVGPGGCSGGQACSTDGTHFEACDCAPSAN